MKSTMTKERMEQILADAPKAINGKNFRFEQRTANYTDERGFPRSDTFTALCYRSDVDGRDHFIGLAFIWW